jgi:hypothetical protein
MRNESHKSLISRIADYIDDWRKNEGMSQTTVVDHIVRAHDSIDGPAATGIHFENNPDEFNRMKANSDRVWRWLDDKSKDRNLLPVNFLPSILAAMPDETRRAFLSELVAPLGLGIRALDSSDEGEFDFEEVCDSHIEATNAVQLIAMAHKNPTEANLEKAERAAQKVTERFARTRKVIAGAKAAMCKARSATGAVINKALHRKVGV